MRVEDNDSEILVAEFNERVSYVRGPLRRRLPNLFKHKIISQLDNAVSNIPSNIRTIFDRYTMNDLIEWYKEKRRTGEIQ